jgi:hypothetical protein
MKWFVGYDTSIERYNAVNTVAWNPIVRIDGSRLDHLRADQISNLDGLPFITACRAQIRAISAQV